MKYFHSTPLRNVGSILFHGIDSLKSDEAFEDGLNYIHDETHAYNDFIADLLGSEWVASFEVDVEGLTLHEGPDGPGTYTVKEPITPGRLTLLGFQGRDGQWAPVHSRR